MGSFGGTGIGSPTDRSAARPAGPTAAAGAHGIELRVVKHAGAKKGFVLLLRRWVVERSFGWLARFRRVARDYERLAETVADWRL